MKEFFRSLFGASGKEVSGLFVIIILLVLALLIPKLFRSFSGTGVSHSVEDQRHLDSLVAYLETNFGDTKETEMIAPYLFDPNTATVEDLKVLGFGSAIANRIRNYREKGGSFKVKRDLYKIYDIDSILVDNLYAYIDLPDKLVAEKESIVHKMSEKSEAVARNRAIMSIPKDLPRFDINQADTSMLQTIKGIGSVLSNRIITFRDKLGGFVELNQLFEVYNLDSVVIDKLKEKVFITEDYQPDPILINKFDEDKLASHPYLTWQQARLIAAYRDQHGNFKSADDLLKVYAIEEDDILKINAYISWESDN